MFKIPDNRPNKYKNAWPFLEEIISRELARSIAKHMDEEFKRMMLNEKRL